MSAITREPCEKDTAAFRFRFKCAARDGLELDAPDCRLQSAHTDDGAEAEAESDLHGC